MSWRCPSWRRLTWENLDLEVSELGNFPTQGIRVGGHVHWCAFEPEWVGVGGRSSCCELSIEKQQRVKWIEDKI